MKPRRYIFFALILIVLPVVFVLMLPAANTEAKPFVACEGPGLTLERQTYKNQSNTNGLIPKGETAPVFICVNESRQYSYPRSNEYDSFPGAFDMKAVCPAGYTFFIEVIGSATGGVIPICHAVNVTQEPETALPTSTADPTTPDRPDADDIEADSDNPFDMTQAEFNNCRTKISGSGSEDEINVCTMLFIAYCDNGSNPTSCYENVFGVENCNDSISVRAIEACNDSNVAICTSYPTLLLIDKCLRRGQLDNVVSPLTKKPPVDSGLDATDVFGTSRKDLRNCTGAECVNKNPITKTIIIAINLMSALIGIIVVAVIVTAGMQYSSSGGEPQKAAQAKKRILNAIIALIAYFFLFAALQWLIPGGLFS